MGKLQINGGLKVQGRVVGSGDDEGIVIDYASNDWAGLTLGSPSAKRSVFYLSSSGLPRWRYNDGTDSYDILHPSKAGTIALTSDIPTTMAWSSITGKPSSFTPSSHSHSYIEAKGNYTFTSSTLPNSFDLGVSAGFVDSNSGFGSYGSVLTVRTYTGGGGSLQLYAPYSSSYGGTRLKARFGNYASSSGNSWTDLKELAWLSDLTWSNISGKPSTFTPASHTHSQYASIGAHNNLTASGNEFTFASSAFSGVMFVNYRTASGNQDGSISEYRFQNGAGKETAIRCSYMYGTAQAADYATSAGNADSVDGWHSGSFMKVTGPVSSPNIVYDTVASMIQGASGSPSGSQYGAFLTLPYRKTFDNTQPDFAGQIFIPNGDDSTTPDGLYYRTSMSTSWRNWKSVIHSCSATYFGGTLPSSGMNTGDVFFKT